MILDTTDCMIIRQSELGIYDTSRVRVVYAGAGWVRLTTGEYFKLQDNEQLIEGAKQ